MNPSGCSEETPTHTSTSLQAQSKLCTKPVKAESSTNLLSAAVGHGRLKGSGNLSTDLTRVCRGNTNRSHGFGHDNSLEMALANPKKECMLLGAGVIQKHLFCDDVFLSVTSVWLKKHES